MRAVVGIIVGLIASLIVAVIAGIIAVKVTFSLPPGTNAANTREVIAIMSNLPTSTQIGLGVAWLAGGFAGAVVAKLIARKAWVAWAVAVGAMYLGLSALVLPLAFWIQALWIVGPLLGGLIGNALVRTGAAPEVVVVEGEEAPVEI